MPLSPIRVTMPFEVIGPMARTTTDAALLFAAIAGPDPRDRLSLAFPTGTGPIDAETRRQRILYVPRFGGSPIDPEISAHVAEAARNLEALGHRVEEGEAPFDLAALDQIWSVIAPAGLAWFLRGHPGWEGKVQEAMRRLGSDQRASVLHRLRGDVVRVRLPGARRGRPRGRAPQGDRYRHRLGDHDLRHAPRLRHGLLLRLD
jgi:Asp-tRNA(Asn)/Glu-tRNA(Gln) amidotransferase A subunit family amidase